MVFGGKLFVWFVFEEGMLLFCIFKFENYDGEIFGCVNENWFVDESSGVWDVCYFYKFLEFFF